MYAVLADKYHWTPEQVGRLTMVQACVYCGARLGAVHQASSIEAIRAALG